MKKKEQKEQFDQLVEKLQIQIRLGMDATHERANDIVSRLDISSYQLLNMHGQNESFSVPPLKTKGDVMNFQRYHQAAARLLDLGVIEARYDRRQNLYAYHWTYPGKLMLIKLGIRQPPKPSPYSPSYYTCVDIVNMSNIYNINNLPDQ